MMCQSAESFQLRSWLNMLINDTQGSGGCERDEDQWFKMNDSFDPKDLLPADPFEMNLENISASMEEWIGYNPDDYEVDAVDPFFETMEGMKINGSQVSRGCGRDEDWIKMNCSCDPIDLLPDDPFEMNMVSEIDIGKITSGEIERWIGCSTCDCKVLADDLSLNSDSRFDFYTLDFSGSYVHVTGEGIFGAMEEASFPGWDFSEPVLNMTGYQNFGAFDYMKGFLVSGRGFSGSVLDIVGDGNSGPYENLEDILYTGRRKFRHPDGDANPLLEGLFLSLGYLGVRDLLSVERVCRSLRYAVQNDPLLWRCIHIDSSLGEKITDDDLYRLTQRAQGYLHCLILLHCPNITEDGLKRVLDSNPTLIKLNVPGCIRMTKGLIENLRTLEFSGLAGMNQKVIRHFIGSIEDFEELRLLGCAEEPLPTNSPKLHCFHDENSPTKGTEHCRACCACTERCAYCGRCIDNCDFIETFELKCICTVCAGVSEDEEDDDNYKKFVTWPPTAF